MKSRTSDIKALASKPLEGRASAPRLVRFQGSAESEGTGHDTVGLASSRNPHEKPSFTKLNGRAAESDVAPITIGYDSEWAHLARAETVASHRSTTSSRHPGVQFKGTVRHALLELRPCECGGLRPGTGPHSPHWARRASGPVQVDCMGREVAR